MLLINPGLITGATVRETTEKSHALANLVSGAALAGWIKGTMAGAQKDVS